MDEEQIVSVHCAAAKIETKQNVYLLFENCSSYPSSKCLPH